MAPSQFLGLGGGSMARAGITTTLIAGKWKRRGAIHALLAPRIWISAGITGFFVFMCVALWRREAALDISVQRLGISPEYLAATWSDYQEANWIERSGERIGVSLLQIRREESTSSYDLSLFARLTLAVLGTKVPVELKLAVDMNERFEMQNALGQLTAGGQPVTVESFVEGLKLYYRMKGPAVLIPGGDTAGHTVLKEPVILADAIRPILTKNQKLKVGNKWSTEGSDPIGGRFNIRVTLEVASLDTIAVGGNSVEAFRVIERAGEVQTTSWYDAEGNLVKSDLGNGLMMVRADLKEVLEKNPDLRLPPRLPQLDKDAIRSEAAQSTSSGTGPAIPWWPNL